MSGYGGSTTTVFASGDDRIDGILTDERWNESEIEFSFPTSGWIYDYFTETDLPANLVAATSAQQNAVFFALDANIGGVASAGFAVEGLTSLTLTYDSSPDTSILSREAIRIANTTSNSVFTAQVTDFPGNDITFDQDDNGDVWFGTYNNNTFRSPVAGNYAWLTHIHELGHALGLSHGHDTWEIDNLPYAYDSMEYSVMTYRSYVGGPTNGYTNETWGYAQTWMMLDIAALQYMYGANFTRNSGDTVYKWNPGSGDTLVNGQVAIDAGGNVIFATIWDGGGIDTYDLSSYSSDLTIDLRPGEHSIFDQTQLAELGYLEYARGSIFNALQYQGDARSLIENATGGTGDDELTGNTADNTLLGGNGDDTMVGYGGHDSLEGGDGNDSLRGNAGDDTLKGGDGADILRGLNRKDVIHGGAGNDELYGGNGYDTLLGQAGKDTLRGQKGEDSLSGGKGNDRLFGAEGHDTLNGGADNDRLFGGKGNDVLIGGEGDDFLSGGEWADTFIFEDGFGTDTIGDFSRNNLEKIDLSAVTNITDYNDMIANHLADEGGFAKIVDGSNSILLDGIAYTDLRDGLNGYTEDDFLF